jgi:hypothetical protein
MIFDISILTAVNRAIFLAFSAWLGCAYSLNGADNTRLRDITFLNDAEREFYNTQWKKYVTESQKDAAQALEKRELRGITMWLLEDINRTGSEFDPISIHVVAVATGASDKDGERGILNVERSRTRSQGECLFSWIRINGSNASTSIAVTGNIRVIHGGPKGTESIYNVRRLFVYRKSTWIHEKTTVEITNLGGDGDEKKRG